METVKFQRVSEKVWYDETGNPVQTSRLTATEKLMERNAERIYRRSKEINKLLKEFKELVKDLCQDVYETYAKEKNVDLSKSKGNFAFYNFNRTVKIEVNVSDRIEFDELGIKTARQLFEEFLSENVSTKDEVIKRLIMDAFSTRHGKLDSKKILNLIRYKHKISDERFQKAISILEESIRKPSSKNYFRIFEKDEHGSWKHIELNFSAI